MTEDAAPPPDLINLAADVVTAYVANNSVPVADLPGLIATTYDAFAALGGVTAAEPAAVAHVPAVSVRKSLADRDRIVSMIDGKGYASLKRHLGAHGLTPTEYRARYRLPADYPMVAPGYSQARSALAKALGLGRKPKAVEAAAPAKRGRPAKTATAPTAAPQTTQKAPRKPRAKKAPA